MDAVKHAVFPQVAGRMPSIDAARAIAIFAVLAIHCDPFIGRVYSLGEVSAGELIDLAGRFAVPFFFVVSGYLLGERCRKSGRDLRVVSGFAGRLAGLVLFWYAFYLLWTPDWNAAWEGGWIRLAYWRAAALFGDGWSLLAGPRAHLWFLPALLIGTLHVFAVMRVKRRVPCLVYFALLYAMGLGAGAYADHPLLGPLSPGVPGGLMCAPLIIATGWWSAGGTVRMGRRVACFLFIGGTVATFVEAWTLLHIYGVPLEGHDFLLATPFQVWGLLNLLRLYPSWAVGTPLPQWGRYTLGVYAGHVAVMEVLGAREGGGLLWEFLKTPLVYLLTLSVVGLLARWPRVRPFFA